MRFASRLCGTRFARRSTIGDLQKTIGGRLTVAIDTHVKLTANRTPRVVETSSVIVTLRGDDPTRETIVLLGNYDSRLRMDTTRRSTHQVPTTTARAPRLSETPHAPLRARPARVRSSSHVSTAKNRGSSAPERRDERRGRFRLRHRGRVGRSRRQKDALRGPFL